MTPGVTISTLLFDDTDWDSFFQVQTALLVISLRKAYLTSIACHRNTNPSRIWEHFIPFPNLQVFHRGAYFSVEVIPSEVAVISLNTMYFYDSNKGKTYHFVNVTTANVCSDV